MTLERFIGYSGFLLIILHIIPFSNGIVNVVTIVLGLGLILAGTYLRWKNKIRHYLQSDQGHMTIPRFFERLEAEAELQRHGSRSHKNNDSTIINHSSE